MIKQAMNIINKLKLPLKISFKRPAITPCCSYEQWFSIFKNSGYLIENKILKFILKIKSYGEAVNACDSIAIKISRNVTGTVNVFPW